MDVGDEGNLEVFPHIDGDPHREDVNIVRHEQKIRGHQEDVGQLAPVVCLIVASALACVCLAWLLRSGVEYYSALVRENESLTLELEELRRKFSDQTQEIEQFKLKIDTLKHNHASVSDRLST